MKHLQSLYIQVGIDTRPCVTHLSSIVHPSPHRATRIQGCLPPVRRRLRSNDKLRLVERLQHLLRERALLRVRAVLLELFRAARAQDDAILWRQRGVVLAPAQRDLRQAQVVLLLLGG